MLLYAGRVLFVKIERKYLSIVRNVQHHIQRVAAKEGADLEDSPVSVIPEGCCGYTAHVALNVPRTPDSRYSGRSPLVSFAGHCCRALRAASSAAMT